MVVPIRDPRLDALLLREIRKPNVAPTSAIVWARREASANWTVHVGAVGEGASSCDAVFDLASITKAYTAVVAARLVEASAVRWSTTVSEVLPALIGLPAGSATLEDLLSHRAGAPAWGALYRREPFARSIEQGATKASLPPDEVASFEEMLRRAASRLETRPIGRDAEPLYSDIGYVLAGAMLARLQGDLPECGSLAESWGALGGATSAALYRTRDSTFDARVVATEEVHWRGGVIRGEVHDENACLIERAGGTPGHAGAFGTAVEVATMAMRFVDALLEDGTTANHGARDGMPILSASTAEWMIAPRTQGTHRVGWDSVSASASSSGSRFGARSFGHLGFTGTSVWADPDARVVAVLLTNRVHPSRDNIGIRAARPRVHDALWKL